MLADGLSKPAAKLDGLLHTLQTGNYSPPQGWAITPNPMAFEKLWVALPDELRNRQLAAASAHVSMLPPGQDNKATLPSNPSKHSS